MFAKALPHPFTLALHLLGTGSLKFTASLLQLAWEFLGTLLSLPPSSR